ncbi:RNA methyltransferase [Babesia microti strain RI]|uniref:16S rRNA (uracil(1498)-N(3))-methyltransferase n=1 Tax=Babesia microti (strain RI) TaxID=1133968 RepID=A0A1N6LXS2_BABMR|nr:RNA methyltransferase [Babesia microti strain RI]SIO73661.1 RNA methyltransferase [Babesia microti strain RI]|eukprot:XP_021337735.1 RNA methyltransferase [Babesia microti strain RI]
MNLILISSSDIIDTNNTYTAVLKNNHFLHCVNVLKSKIGDTLRIGVINHGHGLAIVKNITNEYITIELEQPLHLIKCSNTVPVLDIAFVIPRPKAIDNSIKIAVTLGVGKISLICTDNIEKSYLLSSHITPTSVESCIKKGLEQCMDTRPPSVDLFRSWNHFIDYLNTNINYYKLIYVLHDKGTDDLSHVIDHRYGPILLIIGPERGWLDAEIDKFESLNCRILSLGSRILTCSTALSVSLGLFSNLLTNKSLRNGLHPANRNANVIPGNLLN